MLSQEDLARWKSPTRDRAFQSAFVKARAGGNVNDGYTAGVLPFPALIITRHPLDWPPGPDRVEHNPRIATMGFSNIDVSVFDRVIDVGDDGNRSADLFGPQRTSRDWITCAGREKQREGEIQEGARSQDARSCDG